MLSACKSCSREFVANEKKAGDGQFICSRCLIAKREHPGGRLGLHPALEKIWATNVEYERSHTKSHLSKSLFGDALNRSDKKRISLSDNSSMPRFPGYEITYQIGRGAMGSVFRARQVTTGKAVAIKVLSHELTGRADLIARFERETYALKAISNPHVVSIIDAGQVDNTHYFVMDFIEGITLRTRINRGAISFLEASAIARDILTGLSAAHRHGIVHRDLKPENVLLAYDGKDYSQFPERAVVVDFGLVGIGGLLFDPHPNLTRSRVTMGTLNYMAPEQHIDAKRVDHRSDIYSSGVILFEMLTGELPLGRYHLPHERGMDLPQELDDVLSRALARPVDQRFASANAFEQALSKLKVKKVLSKKSLAKMAQTMSLKQAQETLVMALKKSRYALLLLVAALFFAVGVYLSLDDQGQDSQSESSGQKDDSTSAILLPCRSEIKIIALS